ncbi:hypothetical protein JCM11491_004924 [Sporobolomyces phaffii]
MSQYQPAYDEYHSPSRRPHRPPPSVDQLGFQTDLPHSSSSVYDNPDELETLRELDGDFYGQGTIGLDEAEQAGDEAEEAENIQESEYDAAVMSIDENLHQAPPRDPVLPTSTAPVQYYDDLLPQSGVLRNNAGLRVAQNASSANRIRKGGIKLIPVSRLPDAFRSIWRFGVFNAVQSCCFDSVYGTDGNVVASAPTGAGKTVLFELAIIRAFTNAMSDQCKVLYVAPTKSLCGERAQDWRNKFEHTMGWKVVELTGDSDVGSSIWREVASSRIIVTTPEKWDAITRRWHDHDRILSELRLLCIDEVHSVGTDVRGAVLEVVVSRMKTLGTSTRFVAVSATVPNIQDVADWLRNTHDDEPATVFEFGDEFRPCPLQKIVYGYASTPNEFGFTKTLDRELFSIIKKHASGNPVLIFCSTRKGCVEAAEQLAKDYKQSFDSTRNRQTLAWPKPLRADLSLVDKQLSALIENGVSFHHAGMEQNDRKLVEKLFLDGKISVICSTSTLAVGVNLPARLVIVRGTKGYKDGGFIDYADMDLLQMIGRAGRPQFDRLGVAVIMTRREHQQKYDDLVHAHKNLESSLHKNLTEHVNSEIILRTITDVASALRWLRSTFLYVRISKNPPFYALSKSDQVSPDARLEEICVEAVAQLVKEGIVAENADHSLASNDYGDIMARFYISHPTFVALKSTTEGANMRRLLETLSRAEEFSSFRLRLGEKSILAKVNKSLRFPVEKVATTADRIMILIQVVLEGISGQELRTENVNPLLEINTIWLTAVRITKAMFDLAILRNDASARIVMELLRSLNGRCWDGTSFVLRQLKGALVDAGIRSFGDVAAARADRIELILNRKPPFGSKLVNQAKTFPSFQIALSIEHEVVRDGGVEVELRVGVSLVQSELVVTKKGDMKLYASLMILTSDNHFIEYRRCPLSEIAKGAVKPFSLSVILVKPSQRIVVSASCDLLAGSEVRAEVKPATRPSDFPVPLTDTEEEVDSTEARRRGDGKYECGHHCGDKTKCKHLCCREGLDRPPRKAAAPKKRKVSKSRSNSLDQTATLTTSKTQSRIPMQASSGVTLSQDASGRVVTRTRTADAAANPPSPSATILKKNSRSRKKHTSLSPLKLTDNEDDTFEFPTPEQLVLDSCARKDKKKRKKVVVAEPPPRSRTASPDSFPLDDNDDGLVNRLSPPPPSSIFVKKKPVAAAFKKSTLALKGKANVSLREFDSSDEDMVDVPAASKPHATPDEVMATDEVMAIEEVEHEDEPVFGRDLFAPNSDPSEIYHDYGEDGPEAGGCAPEDDLDTALAIARSLEDVAGAESDEMVADQKATGSGGTREHRELQAGRTSALESGTSGVDRPISLVDERGDDDDDDDDDRFNAWLEGNVIITE